MRGRGGEEGRSEEGRGGGEGGRGGRGEVNSNRRPLTQFSY